MKQSILLSKSAFLKNENHNLFKNSRGENPMWWCHFTIVDGAKQSRIRCSLKTKSLDKAKKIRDSIIADADTKGLVTWK